MGALAADPLSEFASLEAKDAALVARVEALVVQVVALTRHNIQLDRRVAELESRSPPPRSGIPPGWVTARQASALSGTPRSTLYEWARQKRIVGVRIAGTVFIDPSSLPGRA
jgi:hypothetical protein